MKPQRAGLSLLLFFSVTSIYLANGRGIGAGDTVAARYLPWSLLREGNLDLDEFPFLYEGQALQTVPLLDGVPYYLRYLHGHYLPAYSAFPALVALPVYALPVLAGLVPTSPWAAHLEKLSAALITALSVVLLFSAARRLAGVRWALVIALVYGLGTSCLSVSSQALWQHGPSQLFLTLLLYWLTRGLEDERYLAYTGFAMGAAVVMRSTDVLLVLPAAAWILYMHRRQALGFLLCALPPLGAVLLYNLWLFGSPIGGAGNTSAPMWAFFVQTPLGEGISGLLASPSRGLFIYSPVLLFSLLGMTSVWRTGPSLLKPLVLGPILVVLLVAKWFVWWGGYSYGPRLLADVTPILCFFLYPIGGLIERRRLLKWTFCALAGVSIGAHVVGAWRYDGRWDRMADVQRHPSGLWSWRRSPLAFYGREIAQSARHLVRTAPAGPTSADSPSLLAATYELAPMKSEVFAAEPLEVSLRATNTGSATWLADAPGDRGAVQLGWSWHVEGRETSSGRKGLRGDVSPGQTARFRFSIPSPSVPGDYTLALDLVSGWIAWFADLGLQPLHSTVRVLPLESPALRAEPGGAGASDPTVAIATDRTSYHRRDDLHLTIELSNRQRPRRFDAYVVLQAPDGELMPYDGRRGIRTAGWQSVPWVRELPLPARATGRFTVPLSMLEPGRYRWHVVLTETKPRRTVAHAVTDFRVSP